MRIRIAALASFASVALVAALPAVATAAPHHNRGLTINVAPRTIIAGEGVLIYGQLNGTDVAGKKIVLYHHISGSARGFSKISVTKTDSHGFYEFTRAEGIVMTNRSWFTRGRGAPAVHSRRVRERVMPLVSLSADRLVADTSQPILFSGHVSPDHRSQVLLLQQQFGAGDHWRTLKRTRLGPASNYTVSFRFRVPGSRAVRVLFRGDRRNIKGASDPVSVLIQQAQVPAFTIGSSAPVIDFDQSATVSGVLYKKGTKTPLPSTPVTLCSKSLPGTGFTCGTAIVTGPDGGYSFQVTPVHNTVYLVQMTLAPHRHTARLFEGVRDTVSLSVASSHAVAGQTVTLTGTAMPDKAGDVVYLQRLGTDNAWHTVAVSLIRPGSTFQFEREFGTAGPKTFRARIPGDPANVGGASAPVTVTVSLPPVSALPGAA